MLEAAAVALACFLIAPLVQYRSKHRLFNRPASLDEMPRANGRAPACCFLEPTTRGQGFLSCIQSCKLSRVQGFGVETRLQWRLTKRELSGSC